MQTLLQERRRALEPDAPVVATLARERRARERSWLGEVIERVTTPRPPRPASGEALVASSMKVNGADRKAIDVRRTAQPWQHRAFDYYDLVPEIWYAGQFYSRHMAKVELLAQRWDNEKGDWVDEKNSPAQEFLDSIKDANGDRASLVGTYGRLRFLTGECFMCQLAPETDEESWEVLSLVELEPIDGGKKWRRKMSDQADDVEEYVQAPDDMDGVEPNDAKQMIRVWRLWRRHPKRSKQADAPMRAVQDVCEELLLLTLAVRAQARSRIARSGILKVPSEISPPEVGPAKPGEDPKQDKFLKALAEHMEAPLVDEGSASQLVPMLVRGPAAYLKELQQLQLHVAGADYPEAALRSEAIDRLANGLDMPREALVGISGVNHWNAWQIDEDTWVAHVQPVVEELCGEWTAALLRPALEDTDEEPELWRIWYNPAAAVNHPDSGKDAQDTFDRGELNGQALRKAKGFTEDDAPSDADRARFIGIRTRDSVLAMTGKPSLKAGATEAAVPPGSPGDSGDETGPGETAPTQGGTGNDVNVGPPAPTGNEGQARLLGAAEAAVYACRKAAGSRIIQRVPRSARARLEMVPRHQLFAAVGVEELAKLNGGGLNDPYDLVKGGTDVFAHALEAWDYPPERVQALCELVRQHAADTLHQPEPDALPLVILNL